MSNACIVSIINTIEIKVITHISSLVIVVTTGEET